VAWVVGRKEFARQTAWGEEKIFVTVAEAILWAILNLPADPQEFNLFTDIMGCLGAFSKRSSSHPLVNEFITRTFSHLASIGSKVLFHYVFTGDNPAESPSRRFPSSY
jgi:hypothetical protein